MTNRQMRKWSLIGAAAFGLTLGACQSKEEAQKRCQQVVTGFCDHMTECLGEDAVALMGDCPAMMAEQASCDDAVGWVDKNFDACIEDLKTHDCDDMGSLPSKCEGVILHPG